MYMYIHVLIAVQSGMCSGLVVWCGCVCVCAYVFPFQTVPKSLVVYTNYHKGQILKRNTAILSKTLGHQNSPLSLFLLSASFHLSFLSLFLLLCYSHRAGATPGGDSEQGPQ